MIVATAGHIDHGKTSLVRALTGVDTDRLPEERARGISIDLGFAYVRTDGGLVGFVDVPGHERFIRNMLAGVAGIDFALLVVAADDGVMPQTREHLQILHLLDVRQGLVVITKTDRVPASRCDEVADAVQALLAGTSLAGAAVHRVSSISGEGIDPLRRALGDCARAHRSRFQDGHHFRLAVDRVFSVAGAGTVVTGTVFHGCVQRGDRLVVSPAGHPVRVRGIEIRGVAVERAQAGERCALSLAGIEAAQARRGDWVVDERLRHTTGRVDVLLRLLPTEGAALEHWTPVHLHIGTDALTARVSTPGARPIPPGASIHAQLVLDRAALAVNGDRFILRDHSASRTLGGGTILDPFAPRRRSGASRAALLAALELDDPARALQAMLALQPGIVDLGQFQQTFNLTDARLDRLVKDCAAVALGREPRLVMAAAAAARLKEALVAEVGTFHRLHPAAPGMEMKDLQAKAAPGLALDPVTSLVRELAQAGRLVLKAGLVAPPRHDATANPADERLWAAVAPVIDAGGFAPPTAPEIAQTLRVNPARLTDFLYRKSKTGELFRIGEDRFYTRRTVAQLAAVAYRLALSLPDGLFTAAQYRDATGMNRKMAIKVLEFFDAGGITRRVGDARRFRKNPADVYGEPEQTSRHEPARAEE